MTVTCKICEREFNKLITSKHLASHNMLTAEYVELYGREALSCPDYRKARSTESEGENNPNYGNKMSQKTKDIISEKNTGSIPWNKGITIEDTTVYIEAAAKREEKYKNGEITRPAPHIWTEEEKLQISARGKQYAKDHPEELKARAQIIVKTRKLRGNYRYTPRKIPITDQERIEIGRKSKISNAKKTMKAIEEMTKRLDKLNFDVISYTKKTMTVSCRCCGTELTYNKQHFQPSKIRSDLCPVCFPRVTRKSEAEFEMYEFINSHISAISGYKYNRNAEIDIYVPEQKVGFEFNGLYWHSVELLKSIGQSPIKDLKKLEKINNTFSINLIQIFEDEWYNKKDIVKSKILNILGLHNYEYIDIDPCEIREIDNKSCKEFLNKYHIEGDCPSDIRLGLFKDNILISEMTFFNISNSQKKDNWILNRFCSSINDSGVKLFEHFIKDYNPKSITSYSDRRWNDDKFYETLGFNFEINTIPNTWYLKKNTIYRFSKKEIRKDSQIYGTIKDCGYSKWIWKSN